jgi:hypothetical protein
MSPKHWADRYSLYHETCRETLLLGGECWVSNRHFQAPFPDGRAQTIPFAVKKEKEKNE